jgi:hypothetical protein
MTRSKAAGRRAKQPKNDYPQPYYGNACARYYVFALHKCGIHVPVDFQNRCTSIGACSKVALLNKLSGDFRWFDGKSNSRFFVASAKRDYVGVLEQGRFEDVDGVYDLGSLPFPLDIAQVYRISRLETVENPELMFDYTYYVYALRLLGIQVPKSEAPYCNTLEACRKYVKIEPIPEPQNGWMQWLKEKKHKHKKYLAAIPELKTVGVISDERYRDKSRARKFAHVNNLSQAKLFSVGSDELRIDGGVKFVVENHANAANAGRRSRSNNLLRYLNSFPDSQGFSTSSLGL